MSDIYTQAQEDVQKLELKNNELSEEIRRLESLRQEIAAELQAERGRVLAHLSPSNPKTSADGEESSSEDRVKDKSAETDMKGWKIVRLQGTYKAPLFRVWLLLSYPLRSVLLFATRLALSLKKKSGRGEAEVKIEALPPV